VVATTRELIDKGHLGKFRVFACPRADVSNVGIDSKTRDYKQGELSTEMRKGTLSADIVRTWRERWGKGKTLVFAVDRAHAETLHGRFQEAGVKSAYQDGETCGGDRSDIRRGFHNGTYDVVVNIATLTTGTDWDVRCLVLARNTKSEILYTQIVGRGLRTAEGKDSLLLLDHTDTTETLGFVTDIHHEHLDDGKPRTKTEGAEKKKPMPRPCPACASLAPRLARVCPDCGFKLPLASGVTERDGVLVEFVPGQAAKGGGKREHTMAEKEDFYAQLLGHCREKGYKDGWAANKYRDKFGVWPNGMRHVRPAEPSFEVASWIKGMNIRWLKGREKAARMQAAE
jgi:DNA repair protein RadD